MRRINLSHLLEESSKHWPGNIAVLEGHKSYTYRALFDLVTTLSSNLAQFKIPKGARVGLRFPDGVDYILLTLALWNLELAVVPIPGENPAEENSRIVSDLELIGIINNLPGGTPVPGISQAFTTLEKIHRFHTITD